MTSLSLAQLRAHAGRVTASCLAVVIAVGFVVATLALGASSRASVLDAVGARFASADLVVTPQDTPPDEADLVALAAVPGVAAVAADRTAYVQVRTERRSGSTSVTASGIGPAGPLRWPDVSAGRLPAAAGEVAVSDRVGAAVGDTLTVSASPDPEGGPVVEDVSVVGVVDLRGDPRAGVSGRLFATDEQVVAWGATTVDRLRLTATPGTDLTALRARVSGAVPAGATVTTSEQAAREAADAYTGDAASLTNVLLVFGAVAVLVAGLVIANTFAVLLAQRTRELALLRCVGATRGQLGRGVVLEASVVGLLASAVGVAAGVGLAAVVSTLAGRVDSPVPLGAVVVPWSAVVLGLLLGTTVTVLSALAPARAATRVAPLAALRPPAPPTVRSRAGVLRLVVGVLVLVPSGALMVRSAWSGQLVPAVGAGALSFVGFLLVAQRLVPAAVALAGVLVRSVGGVPARLAAGNALRNPGRTAATATALLIGVTLTTAMVVGASSTRATATAALEAGYPTDVVVAGSDPLDDAVLARIADLDAVAAVSPVSDLQVVTADGGLTVQGVDPASVRAVVRSEQRSPVPSDGQLVVSPSSARALGVHDGGTWTPPAVGAVPLTVVLAPGSTLPAVTTVTTLQQDFGGTPARTSAWVRLDDGLDTAAQGRAVDAVTDVVTAAVPTSSVSGVVTERDAFDRVLTTMLLVVTGLLAVAVVIALLGVGNTLALSVVERRQESGLLRALGLTRRQLRALLAWEALLVSGVAAVLGVVLGTGYGLAGTASVLSAEAPVVLDVPWLQVVGVVVVAAAAGVLASVLPARRAALTPPVAAIAD